MKNIRFLSVEHSAWRKIAVGTWNSGGDPSVYGKMEINASLLLEKMSSQHELKKKPPTITLIVARAIALTLHRHPLLNGMIRFGKIYRRPHVQLFIQTTVDDEGKELSGVVIQNAEEKSISNLEQELREKSSAIRKNLDPTFKKVKKQFNLFPSFVLKWILNLTSFFIYTLNLNLSFLGLPRDPFGSVMITSIGSIGLDEAYAPLIPYARVPVLVAVGALQKKAVVTDQNTIVAGKVFSLCVTLDHRFIDGLYASKMAKTMRYFLETNEGIAELLQE